MKDLGAALERLRRERRYRRRHIAEAPQGPETVVDGRPVLAFCSNDYLGLAAHPAVVAALCEGAQRYGAGAGAAHLINGHARPHHELEEALAALTGRRRALLFSTGYMANLGVALALTGHGDLILQDRLNHASLIDAGRLAEARLRRYGHGRVDELATRLAERRGGDCLVMTDGVFSMDGDLAPLPAMAELCRAHGAWLMVDDAHGIGVLGEHGAGTLEHYGLGPGEVPVLMGTLGKALGTFGAFVAGDADLVDYLLQRARTYVYTTATPPGVATATLAALRLLREEPERRARLHANLARFRTGAAERGLPLTDSLTPIQPVLLGSAEAALAASRALLERGILVTAIRPPTVPEGTARLRITLSAAHRPEHVERLLDALAEVLPGDTTEP